MRVQTAERYLPNVSYCTYLYILYTIIGISKLLTKVSRSWTYQDEESVMNE